MCERGAHELKTWAQLDWLCSWTRAPGMHIWHQERLAPTAMAYRQAAFSSYGRLSTPKSLELSSPISSTTSAPMCAQCASRMHLRADSDGTRYHTWQLHCYLKGCNLGCELACSVDHAFTPLLHHASSKPCISRWARRMVDLADTEI